MNALRLVLLGVAAAIVLALSFGGLLGARITGRAAAVTSPALQSAQRDTALRAQIEASLADIPEFQPFFSRFRAAFPSDYAAAIQRGVERTRISGRFDPPEQYLLDSIGIMRRGRGLLAARASDDALSRLFDVQSATMAALAASDPRLCVGFLYGSAGPGFSAFAARNRPLVATLATAGLDAVLDGQTNRIARAAPADSDFQKIESDLTDRGFGRSEIDALLDGRVPDPPLPDAQLCTAARAYLDVLKSLPQTSRMAIYALSVELMSRS